MPHPLQNHRLKLSTEVMQELAAELIESRIQLTNDSSVDPFLRLLFSYLECQVYNCYVSSLGIRGFLCEHANTSIMRKAEWKATLASNPTQPQNLNIQVLNSANFGAPSYM